MGCDHRAIFRPRPVSVCRLIAASALVALACALQDAAGAEELGRSCQAPAVPSSESALDVEGVTVRPGVHTEPVGPDAAAAQAGEATSAGPAAANLSLRRALRVEEMVVTARRREELLQETPISVTALGDDTLREAQVQTLEDL